MNPPFASIIIRSKDRPGELKKLLGICLAQRYPRFEIVIVDSTEGLREEELRQQLGAELLERAAPRVRLVRTPPRGCAAAANEGVRQARGEILVFVDDDDIPVGEGWLEAHLRNYGDPACLGVNGAMLYEGGAGGEEATTGAERWMLSFGFWKNARWYAPVPWRKVGIDFLMGGNASLRRSAYERGGGWDEFLPYHNECSLFVRLGKGMRRTEYLVYDPEAKMRIRRDIPGGVDQRADRDLKKLVDTLAKYYLWVVAPAYPLRIYGLFPAFAWYFARSSARAAAQFMREKEGGAALAGRAYRFALGYAPISLARHLRGGRGRRG